MSSKAEKIIFNGHEDDFVFFAEQFEALIHSIKLGKVLTGDASHKDYMPKVSNGASEEQRAQAVNKRRKN